MPCQVALLICHRLPRFVISRRHGRTGSRTTRRTDRSEPNRASTHATTPPRPVPFQVHRRPRTSPFRSSQTPSTKRGLDPKKMMPNTRDFPPLTPFAASVVEGKRRLPLSDTENLMVGAFGGTLECTVQSECPGPRSRYIPPTVSAAQTTTSDHRTRPPRPQSQCPSSR